MKLSVLTLEVLCYGEVVQHLYRDCSISAVNAWRIFNLIFFVFVRMLDLVILLSSSSEIVEENKKNKRICKKLYLLLLLDLTLGKASHVDIAPRISILEN